MSNENVKITFPDEMYLQFKNFKNQQKVTFVVFADLECLLKNTGDSESYQEHVPFSIAFLNKMQLRRLIVKL